VVFPCREESGAGIFFVVAEENTGSAVERRQMGNFILRVGEFICLLVCFFAIFTTLNLLLPAEVTVQYNLRAMIFLGGLVGFCLCAALLVVFERVLRLK
jgi:hypothetical protein